MTTPHSAAPERSVVDRTLSILAAFDRDNRTLSLSDLSRRSGLPVATVHRIVNKLSGWGALERSADGGYSIGLRLWETGALAPRSATLAETAHPYLVGLHGQTSGAALIAIRDGADSVCLVVVSDDPDYSSTGGDGGRRVPLHASSVGLVLLAHAGEAAQNEICGRPLRAYTSATVTDGTALRRCLVKVRRDGHAVVHNTFTCGVSGFSVPVRDARGTVVAAVGLIGRAEVVQPSRVAGHVHAAAAAVTRGLRADHARIAEVGA